MNENKKKRGWRILRRLLIGTAIFATLIGLLITEENWRGKRAWENCKSELTAQGMVLEWNELIPPTVPDEQNFFKAPKMSEWFAKDFGNKVRDFSAGFTNELSARLKNSNTTINITEKNVAADYLRWSDQFTPQFDLIREALKRPYARMDGDYRGPNTIPIPNFFMSRLLAQVLAQRTKCQLLLGQSDEALQDVTLLNGSRKWLEAAPTGKPMTLVAAMINVAITGLYVNTVAYGLDKHYWSELQLSVLQKQLADINLSPIVAAGFAFEPAAVCRDLEILQPSDIFYVNKTKHPLKLRDRVFDLIPRGWIYQNMATIARLEFQNQSLFDLTNDLIHPDIAQTIWLEKEKIASQSKFAPNSFMVAIAVPNIVKAMQTLGYTQTQVNESQIVCALECFHLTHGEYPEALAAVTPQFITELPHDIVGGAPLHYRRIEDGKFLLYSIGWNETDDGGKTVLTQTGSIEQDQSDWVWQYPQK